LHFAPRSIKQFCLCCPVPEFAPTPKTLIGARFTYFRGCDFRCSQRRESENAPSAVADTSTTRTIAEQDSRQEEKELKRAKRQLQRASQAG